MRSRSWVLLALLAGGCAGDDEPEAQGADALGEQDKEEVARSLGVALSRSFSSSDGLARTSVDVALGAPPAWLTEAEAGVYLGDLLGLQVDVDVSCVDVAGDPMAACGPDADGAAITGNIEGQLSLLGWTGSLGISVGWELAGLQGDQVQVDGSASIELGSEFEDWFQPVTHQATFTIDAELSATLRHSDFTVVSGSAELAIEYVRARSDEGTQSRFEFTVEATVEDGEAVVTIGGVVFRIQLGDGAFIRL
ncbi:MAG TPA: hypothetical protein VNO33_11015 [Kofleriaceae bacterium]|nr:hypothetical protein [Kofleriaceae bacterium]